MGPLNEIYISDQVLLASGGVAPHPEPTTASAPEVIIKVGGIAFFSKTAAAALPEGRPHIKEVDGISD